MFHAFPVDLNNLYRQRWSKLPYVHLYCGSPLIALRTGSHCTTFTMNTVKVSLRSRRNFGERVLSIFLAKIIAAIFYFKGRGRLVRERKLYQGSRRRYSPSPALPSPHRLYRQIKHGRLIAGVLYIATSKSITHSRLTHYLITNGVSSTSCCEVNVTFKDTDSSNISQGQIPVVILFSSNC